MKTTRSKIAILLLLVGLFCIPTSIVVANSLPPPYRIWLRFVNEQEKPVQVTGLQIGGCDDEACLSPIYLIGFGKCMNSQCFTSQPKLQEPFKLRCAGNQCLLESKFNFERALSKKIQFLISTDNTFYKTNFVTTPDCPYCDSSIKVMISNNTATATLDEKFKNPNQVTISNLFYTFLLTIIVEVIVGYLFFMFWKRKSAVSGKKLAWSIVLSNVISYPVAWLTIPSFGRFQSSTMQTIGLIALGVSIVIAAVSLLIAANKEKIKKWMIVVGILLVPVCIFLVLVLTLFLSYGNTEYSAEGLSPAAIILSAEVFAVVCETLFIHQLRKSELKLKQIFILCLVMNALSLALGFLIF
jgi:hypothetical protein